jgi:glycosyltransferase involved in cell wall biosynthesis
MRIAWIGPIDAGGGVPGMGRILLRGLLDLGIEVDVFTTQTEANIRALVGEAPMLRVVHISDWWKWDKWYSRTPFLTFISGLYARAKAHGRLCDRLVEEHGSRQYDTIFQFSQMELLRLNKYLAMLPPVVVYCCVHAAGELTWHRRESRYARQSESTILHYITRRVLAFRAGKQRKEARKPAMLIGMSKRFNELIAADYGLDPSRLRVLYHPIEQPAEEPTVLLVDGRKVQMVFAGRISVRKGVEMLVELSKRLDDISAQVEMVIIGGHTQWSDYRKHLDDLNPRVARYPGSLPNKELIATFARSDIFVIPSHYEPGGIVAGESISRGMTIVASDEVGSVEPMNGDYVITFRAGDMDAFERACRQMIDRVKQNRLQLAADARRASIELFDPHKIARQLLVYLREARK